MMRWLIALSALLLLSLESPPLNARNDGCPETGACAACHQVQVAGPHAAVACADCHGQAPDFLAAPGSAWPQVGGCLSCHQEYSSIQQGSMASREAEKQVVDEIFQQVDPHFFDNNCQSCHLGGCLDCHGPDGHHLARPTQEHCQACHRGYFTGAEYAGRAPREDALRYQRGPAANGEHYLKMAPDVHARAGLECGACHPMASLAGDRPPRGCRECHAPDPQVIEHAIAAHLEKLECYACHAAWAPQEYGTFYVRVGESKVGEYFRVKDNLGQEYIKSSYLKRQNGPPLGLNFRGKVSPIRPQFIFYYSDLRPEQPAGRENQLLGARWQAFFPHTIQRGTVMCDGCHHNPARFLLEPEEDAVYQPDRDGLGLKSFWRQEGQQLANGSFFPPERYQALSRKTPAYTRAYVERWKQLVDHVEDSSKQ